MYCTTDTLLYDESLRHQTVYIASMFLLYLFLKYSNNPNINSMSGVWQSYKEINELHIHYIDENFKTIDDLKNANKK